MLYFLFFLLEGTHTGAVHEKLQPREQPLKGYTHTLWEGPTLEQGRSSSGEELSLTVIPLPTPCTAWREEEEES